MNRRLDPRARSAAELIQAYRKHFSQGPLVPSWLSPALPPRSRRRGWRDYVAVYILCDIISAHRLIDGEVFFRGPLFQVNREQWAEQIPTTLKEISLTLTWLADRLGVIGRVQRIRMEDGQPRGSQTFVWPIVSRIQGLWDYFQEHGRAMPVASQKAELGPNTPQSGDGIRGNSTPTFEATPPPNSMQLHAPIDGHSSLISAATPTTAEGSGESPAVTNPTNPTNNVRSGRGRAGAGGGGTSEHARASDTASEEADSASPSSAPSTPAILGDVVSTNAAPPRWSPPHPPNKIQVVTDDDHEAWRRAMRFRALWQEAIVRSRSLFSCKFTLADVKAAYGFFQNHPDTKGFLPLAVAIHAWTLAREKPKSKIKRRRIYHILNSLDPRQFIASMHTGKVEAEVGMFSHVNSWDTLRWYFTVSELVYFGWPEDKLPVREADPDDLWEYNPSALAYYCTLRRDPPPEIHESQEGGE